MAPPSDGEAESRPVCAQAAANRHGECGASGARLIEPRLVGEGRRKGAEWVQGRRLAHPQPSVRNAVGIRIRSAGTWGLEAREPTVAGLCKMARSIGHKAGAKGSRAEAAILGRESAPIESIGKPRFDLAGDERLRGDLVSKAPRAKQACE